MSKKKRGPLVVGFKFEDGSREFMKFSDAIYAGLLQAAAIVRSPQEHFSRAARAAAEKRLRTAAEAVAEKQYRLRNASALRDSDILAAVAAHKMKKDAAAALGLTDRQLRTRLKSIQNRKS